jgi:hypothetical protein
MVKQAKDKTKQASKKTWDTSKRVLAVAAALATMAPVAAGAYSVWYGRDSLSGLAAYSVVFTGAVAGVYGLIALYHVMLGAQPERGR